MPTCIISIFVLMATLEVTSKGRKYQRGKPLSLELRDCIIDTIIDEGGDIASGYFPGSYKAVGERFKVSDFVVRKLWKQVCSDRRLETIKHQTGNPARLKHEDLQLIETIKTVKPSTSYEKIKEEVERYCTVDGGTSKSAIGRAVRTRMSKGPWSWKRLSKHCYQKFNAGNVIYAQALIDFLHEIPPKKLKYFDEAGVHSGVGNPVYGHSLIGTDAVELVSVNKGVNYTLNLLCGLEGVLYANVIRGGSDTIDYLNFWQESVRQSTNSGAPVLENGDVIIVDNAPIHRHEGGEALARWFADMGIYVVYTPTRSPEFNAAELIFNKIKTLLKRDTYRELLRVSVPLAVYSVLSLVSENDMVGFYRKLGYLNI